MPHTRHRRALLTSPCHSQLRAWEGHHLWVCPDCIGPKARGAPPELTGTKMQQGCSTQRPLHSGFCESIKLQGKSVDEIMKISGLSKEQAGCPSRRLQTIKKRVGVRYLQWFKPDPPSPRLHLKWVRLLCSCLWSCLLNNMV